MQNGSVVPFFPHQIRSPGMDHEERQRVRRVFNTYFIQKGGVWFLAYIQPHKDFVLKKHTLTFISVFPHPPFKNSCARLCTSSASKSQLVVWSLCGSSSSELLSLFQLQGQPCWLRAGSLKARDLLLPQRSSFDLLSFCYRRCMRTNVPPIFSFRSQI